MAKQSLGDILGKTGDFQFSFAIEDMISPAIENIDQASHVMMEFFRKSSKTVSKQMVRGQKFLSGFLRRDGKAAKKTAFDVAAGLRASGKEADLAEDKVLHLGSALKEMTGFQGFRDLQSAVEGVISGKVVDSAEEFVGIMSGVANTLGKTRTSQLNLTNSVIEGVAAQSRFAASSTDAIQAVEGLVNAGVRNEAQLLRLAPAAAIAANAVNGDAGSITAAFYELEDRIGISKGQINDVFANWKVTSEKVAISFSDMQDTFTSPEFYTSFRRLTENMASDTKVNMLTTLGHIRGSFADEWADSSDFIDKIMGAMTDPTMAHQMVRMTGMSAHNVKEMLKTTEGSSQFFSQLMDHVDKTATQGSGSIKMWEETLGFASGSLLELQKNTGPLRVTFKDLQDAQIGAGEGTVLLTKRATENLTFTEKWSRALSHLATVDLPGLGFNLMDVANALAEFPVKEVLSLVPALSILGALSLPAIATSSAMAAAGVTSIGGAFTYLAFTAFPAAVSAAAPFLAIPALIAGASYLIWTNFDKIRDSAVYLWEFLMGRGDLEKGWLGTLQGVLRVVLLPMRVVLVGLFGMAKAAKSLVGAFSGLEIVQTWFEGVSLFVDALGIGIVKLAGLLTSTLKNAFSGAINAGFIDPLNQRINIPIPFTNKTMGSVLGLQAIPRLGAGGVVSSPMIAEIAEEGPEAVIPLADYSRLLVAAQASREPSRAPQPGNVIVNQDRVVRALERLERTLTEVMQRTSLPTRGSAFGSSPMASPRGI